MVLCVLEVLEIEKDLKRKKQLKRIEEYDEQTPPVVLFATHALEGSEIGLDGVEDASSKVGEGQDHEDCDDLLPFEVRTLKSRVQVHPLEPMHHTDQRERKIVQASDIDIRAEIVVLIGLLLVGDDVDDDVLENYREIDQAYRNLEGFLAPLELSVGVMPLLLA